MTTAEPPATPPGPTERVVKPKRGSETALDMVRSLGLIAVITAVTLIFVPGLLHPSKKDKFQAIDYSNYVEGFRSITGVAPLLPSPLLTGWSANSAALKGPRSAESMRIGFVTPDQQYLGLIQSIDSPPAAVRSQLGASAATVDGHVDVNGVQWARRRSSQGETALTHTVTVATKSGHAATITIMVTGSASLLQQQAFAATLK